MVLALVRKEVPLREDPGIGYEGTDERVWELLMKCWSYTPQDRPSCETVRDTINNMGIQDDRPKTVIEVGKFYTQPIKKRPDTEIDFARVREILVCINTGTTPPPPVGTDSIEHGVVINTLMFYRYYVYMILILYFVVLGTYPDWTQNFT